jgi:hypothetical protein
MRRCGDPGLLRGTTPRNQDGVAGGLAGLLAWRVPSSKTEKPAGMAGFFLFLLYKFRISDGEGKPAKTL